MLEKIAIVGLGYVGLPLALALAKKFPGTIGFDIDSNKIKSLKDFSDPSKEVSKEELQNSTIHFSSEIADLKSSTFFIVAVPTPVDQNRSPDLSIVISASKLVGSVLQKNSVIVFESTVYPGVTEEICGEVIEQVSGLKSGVDFKLGYSPERINPGDKEHSIEKIIKIVSAQDKESLERVSKVYGEIIEAGIHQASSIKVAEAAKVIENTQRDLNIALMNELSIIFDKMNINTQEVLEAAGTKWNFIKFTPGLVGGHCIGVDPYYLTTKAEQLGYHPEVILAGRKINDGMGSFVAQKTIKLMIRAGSQISKARVGILGLTFKEDVSDIRNSRIPDIVKELSEFGVQVLVHDPYADSHLAEEEYHLKLAALEEFSNLDAIILAVPHKFYREFPEDSFIKMLKSSAEKSSPVKQSAVIIDIKAVFSKNKLSYPKLCDDFSYWSL